MRLSALITLTLVASAAPAGATGPLDPVPALVITGRASATATFTLTTWTEYRLSDAEVTYAGRYAGVEIFRVTGLPEGGLFASEDFANSDPLGAMPRPPVMSGPDVHSLPPGTYRVYLLTDAEATIRLPLSAGSSVTVRPTKHIRTAYAASAVNVVAGSTAAAVRLPLGPTVARTFGQVFAQYTPSGTSRGMKLKACITANNESCATGYATTTMNTTGLWSTLAGIGSGGFPAGSDGRGELTATTTAGGTLSLVTILYDRV